MDRRGKLALVMFLTFARFPLVLIFLAGAVRHAFHPSAPLFLGVFALLILTALTDLVDGHLARRFNVVTQLGAHADPLMDKFFYLATFPLAVFLAAHNGRWTHAVVLLGLTVLFLTRDQWVTFLRSFGSLGDLSGRANWSGKLRTGMTFPLLCAVYYFEEAPPELPSIPAWLLAAFEALALAVNFVSAYVYTRQYWPCLRQAAALGKRSAAAGKAGP